MCSGVCHLQNIRIQRTFVCDCIDRPKLRDLWESSQCEYCGLTAVSFNNLCFLTIRGCIYGEARIPRYIFFKKPFCKSKHYCIRGKWSNRIDDFCLTHFPFFMPDQEVLLTTNNSEIS